MSSAIDPNIEEEKRTFEIIKTLLTIVGTFLTVYLLLLTMLFQIDGIDEVIKPILFNGLIFLFISATLAILGTIKRARTHQELILRNFLIIFVAISLFIGIFSALIALARIIEPTSAILDILYFMRVFLFIILFLLSLSYIWPYLKRIMTRIRIAIERDCNQKQK